MTDSEAAPISPYWEQLAIGQWIRVVDQDRVAGTIKVIDQFPDGRTFVVTLAITNVKEYTYDFSQT